MKDTINIKSTTTFTFDNLKPVILPFEVDFKWSKPNHIKHDDIYWFTKSKKCYIVVQSLKLLELGVMDEEVENELVDFLLKHKTQFVTDGINVYTRATYGFARVLNYNDIMDRAIREYDARFSDN